MGWKSWAGAAVGGTIGFFTGGPAGAAKGAAAGYALGTGTESVEEMKEASERAAATTREAQMSAQELGISRFGEARELLSPYIGGAEAAHEQQMIEMGLAPGEAGAYMETPGYQALLEERQRGAEQAAAGERTLYSGRRIQEAADIGGATQSQFYTNYMNLLQNMASPGVATNLASLGMGQAATLGQQQMQAEQAAAGYQMAGAQAKQAFIGDVIGAGANIYGGYMAGGGARTPTAAVPATTAPAATTTWI